ncbi:hypothetical protein KAR91_05050 [Candidatus Pacearchaeota archaeon]|nr:hypothetical protein [Candidatus Pacearchaeota archaeon]
MAILKYSALEYTLFITTFDDTTWPFSGEGPDDVFTFAYDNDDVTTTAGIKGDVQFSQTVASLGTGTAVCQWGADTVKKITQMHRDQQAGNFMKKLQLKRNSDSVNEIVVDCESSAIQKMPDLVQGATATPRSFLFKLEKMRFEQVETPS